MTDIVERLRSPEFADVAAKYLMAEAAAEIERLRAASQIQIEALQLWREWDLMEPGMEAHCLYDKAVAKLNSALPSPPTKDDN